MFKGPVSWNTGMTAKPQSQTQLQEDLTTLRQAFRIQALFFLRITWVHRPFPKIWNSSTAKRCSNSSFTRLSTTTPTTMVKKMQPTTVQTILSHLQEPWVQIMPNMPKKVWMWDKHGVEIETLTIKWPFQIVLAGTISWKWRLKKEVWFSWDRSLKRGKLSSNLLKFIRLWKIWDW